VNIFNDIKTIFTKVGLSVPQTKLQQGILDISIKTGFTDSINFNSQIIDNTAFAKQLIFDDLSLVCGTLSPTLVLTKPLS
jgi:ribosomal protein S8